jgi:uncharacterized protein YrrD
MLIDTSLFIGFAVAGIDGEVGTVKDIYFDDEKWIVRYLVVETGGWFNSRKVLISPFSVRSLDPAAGTVSLDLTQERIKNSPEIDTDKPVSRQHETDFYNYYGYPYYWAGPMVWGYTAYPTMVADRPAEYSTAVSASERAKDQERHDDPHLRSSKEVTGYDIQATDDSVGHVEDFLFDERDWSMRFIVVDTRNWWPGKKVLIPPSRISQVSWENEQIVVKLTRAEVENGREYDPNNPPPAGSNEQIYRRFGPIGL